MDRFGGSHPGDSVLVDIAAGESDFASVDVNASTLHNTHGPSAAIHGGDGQVGQLRVARFASFSKPDSRTAQHKGTRWSAFVHGGDGQIGGGLSRRRQCSRRCCS